MTDPKIKRIPFYKDSVQIAYSLLLMGGGAIMGWTFAQWGSGEKSQPRELPGIERNEAQELRMQLPLPHNPTSWTYFGDNNKGRLEMKFELNQLRAMQRRYEKIELGLNAGSHYIYKTYNTSGLTADAKYTFPLPPMGKGPATLPQSLHGIKKDGTKELIFQTPEAPENKPF